jgi:hypothetical protein
VVKRMIRAYPMKDITLCSLIHENPDYKKMALDDVLAIIIIHQMFQEEANFVKNLSKGISSSRKQDITLKACKKSKRKQVIEESSSEEEDESSKYDVDEMTLFIRRFKKFMTKEKFFRGDKKEKVRTLHRQLSICEKRRR